MKLHSLKIAALAALCGLFALQSSSAAAQDNSKNTVKQGDTIDLLIDQAVVVDSPKEHRPLRAQPISATVATRKVMEQNRVFSLKDLTSFVPNFYAPKYGSKLTSSIYVRGIGSRINSSAVGVYVDGIPYYNKSAFDFDYADIERVEVLRGPQGTLYGLGSMGGLINVFTKSPFDYQGTDLLLSAGTKNTYRASVTHYHRISPKFAFSGGGFYNTTNGFYMNAFSGKRIDNEKTGGGRIHAILKPSSVFHFDLNLSYEYTDAGGFPYGEYDAAANTFAQPNYNYESGYTRSLFNAGFTAKYFNKYFTLTSVTGYQNLDDRMKMDQDYSPADLYTLIQAQNENTISEELTAKGNVRIGSIILGSWDWTMGGSWFYEDLKLKAPMTFGSGFIQMLQKAMDDAMVHSPVKVKLTDEFMAVPGSYKTPSMGYSIFHQSVLNSLFGLQGLSLTLGIRWDYQQVRIKYNTGAALSYQTYRGGVPMAEGEFSVQYLGNQKHSYSPLLPRLALKYEFGGDKTKGNVYAIASRGYRGGGYNLQVLGDYMSADVQKNKGILENDETINAALVYKPEYLWNYEAGTHLNLLKNRLTVDASLFYMRIKDQHVARFAEGGLGRYTSNAGRSRSRGFEIAAKAYLLDNLEIAASYGFTDAEFTENSSEIKIDGTLTPVDYKGKKVPFAPRNSLNVNGAYTLRLSSLHSATLYLDYCGLGKIYFTEANDASQRYYSTVNARLAFNFGLRENSFKSIEVALWGTNIFNKKYKVFYFENLSKGYAQRSRGAQAGIDLRFKF